MADKRTRRLSPATQQDDTDALAALDAIEDYSPSNPAYSKENARAIVATMRGKQTKEVQDAAAAKASRDAAVNSEWDTHEFKLGVGSQLIAQFGENSDEISAFGLKKKMEYKSPTRKVKKE